MSQLSESLRVHATSQTSFTSNAVLYDKARPSYIPSAVEAVIRMTKLQAESKLLDLASGTGIFTRLLDNKGFDITAAEPSPGMRATFSSRSPHIPVIAADVYKLPFEDETFDVVTIAQAFHWFADEEALTEIARVLKRKGFVSMIWNLEKLGVSKFMDEHFNDVVAYDGDVPQYRKGVWKTVLENTKAFKTPYDEFLADYSLSYTEEELWDRAKSKSFITALSEDEQNKLKNRLSELVRKYPDTPKDDAGRIICPQFVRVVALQKA